MRLRELLERVEGRTGLRLPRRVIGASLGECGVLLVRFSHPAGSEEEHRAPRARDAHIHLQGRAGQDNSPGDT